MKTPNICLAVLSIAIAASSIAGAADDNAVVARVGDVEVRANDVQSMIDNLGAREKEALSRDPSLLNQSVRMLLAQQLVLKEARTKQWDKQAATMALIEKARDGVVVESYLQSVSKPDDAYPSEADLKAAYEANKAALVAPRQFKLSQIFVKSADAAEKSNPKLDAVKKSLKQPNADFGAVALTQSDDKSTFQNNGELGWIAESALQPEIRAKVTDLAKGAVSEPVRMSDGWHFVKVLDSKESRQVTLDEVRTRLAQQLRAERSRTLRQAYLAGLVKDNPVSVNELAVSGILAKSQK